MKIGVRTAFAAATFAALAGGCASSGSDTAAKDTTGDPADPPPPSYVKLKEVDSRKEFRLITATVTNDYAASQLEGLLERDEYLTVVTPVEKTATVAPLSNGDVLIFRAPDAGSTEPEYTLRIQERARQPYVGGASFTPEAPQLPDGSAYSTVVETAEVEDLSAVAYYQSETGGRTEPLGDGDILLVNPGAELVVEPTGESSRSYQFDYVTFGYWDSKAVVEILDSRTGDTFPADMFDFRRTFFVYGIETEPADVPETGQATYAGFTYGTDYGLGRTLAGEFELTADFATGGLNGEMSLFNIPSNTTIGNPLIDQTKAFPLDPGNLVFTASMSGSIYSGTNSFGGSLTGLDVTGTGAFEGAFFGPSTEAPAEAAGGWSFEGGGDITAAGVFIGAQTGTPQ